jgi:hypothetical protein
MALVFKRLQGATYPDCLPTRCAQPPESDRPLVFAKVDRSPTASKSVSDFMNAVSLVRSSPRPDGPGGPDGPDALLSTAVGLRLDGRSSVFDLYWFAANDEMFAVDVRDKAFVCTLVQI